MTATKSCQQLTPRQAEIYRFIVERIGAGDNPTYRDVCREFDIKSPNGAVCQIEAIARKGWLILLRDARNGSIRLPGPRCPYCNGTGVQPNHPAFCRTEAVASGQRGGCNRDQERKVSGL